MINLGTNEVSKVFLGESKIKKAYLGNDLVLNDSGGDAPTWEEATLNYTVGDSFTLMGVTFTYDSTNNVYASANNTFIYPNEMILTLDPNATTSQAYDVLLGGTNNQNEIWMAGSSNQLILAGIRFQNQVVRNIYSKNNVNIYEVHLTEADKSILLNGEVPPRGDSTYQGTMGFCFINGRASSYHTDCNKVLKIKVR